MRRIPALTLRRSAAAIGIVALLGLPTACKGGGDSNGGSNGGNRNSSSATLVP
jgi:hypothetical protein